MGQRSQGWTSCKVFKCFSQRDSFSSLRVVTLPQRHMPLCSLLLVLQGATLVFPVGGLLQEAEVCLQEHAAIG